MAGDCLFIYGTLRREFQHPLLQSLERYANFQELAHTSGRLLDLGNYPGLVLEPNSSHKDLPVYGDLYAIHDLGPLFLELDAYEECGPGFEEPSEYIRTQITIDLESGPDLKAWTYIYNWPFDNDVRWISSGDYIQHAYQKGLLSEVEDIISNQDPGSGSA